MVDEIINKIISCLENENHERKMSNKKYDDRLYVQIDIPFYISVLKQHLNDEKYHEFINSFYDTDTIMNFIPSKDAYDSESISISYYDKDGKPLNVSYNIIFRTDQRYWGYCQCEPGDKDYDERHKCCGHGCDWEAPAFEIVKESFIGYDTFTGDEHDYWDFKDVYNNVNVEERKEEARKKQIASLREEIEICKQKINDLQK